MWLKLLVYLTADQVDCGANADHPLVILVGHDELDVGADVGDGGLDSEGVGNKLGPADGQGAAIGEGVASVLDIIGQSQILVDDQPGSSHTCGQAVGGNAHGQLSAQGDNGAVDNGALSLIASLNLSPVWHWSSSIA